MLPLGKQGLLISIHALREEGDSGMRSGALNRSNFYPRPPRGGRLNGKNPEPTEKIFLSTPSARRATPLGDTFASYAVISIHALREEGDPETDPREHHLLDFYPRPPRGGRHNVPSFAYIGHAISIHALREEGDMTRP